MFKSIYLEFNLFKSIYLEFFASVVSLDIGFHVDQQMFLNSVDLFFFIVDKRFSPCWRGGGKRIKHMRSVPAVISFVFQNTGEKNKRT